MATLTKFSAKRLTITKYSQYFAFGALTLLVGCQEEHPAWKKISDEVLMCMVICLERRADCLHMVQLVPLPFQNPIISCLI